MARITMVVVACVVWASCGPADRGQDAAAVADRFHAALAERDGETACEELSETTRSALEREEGRPCDEAILGLELPAGVASARAEVYVTSAFVELERSGALFLDEGGGGWKISDAGCRPPAEPAMPHECQLAP